MQKVTSFKPVSRDNVASFRKEASFYKSIMLIDTAKQERVLDVRFYGKSAVYCCAWLAYGYGPNGESARAGAKAGGYGYHKESAALGATLKAMGCTLAEDIDGRGDHAMKEAIDAIAIHLGLEAFMVVVAHA